MFSDQPSELLAIGNDRIIDHHAALALGWEHDCKYSNIVQNVLSQGKSAQALWPILFPYLHGFHILFKIKKIIYVPINSIFWTSKTAFIYIKD